MTRLTSAERRERILASSIALFARRGFAATRTRDVAQAAGVSEAMVFKLFPDKESVYRAILEQRIDAMERAMPLSGLADSPETPERFFGRIAEVALGRIEEDPSFLRLVLFSALEDHPLAAEYHRARAEGAREVISAYLRRQDRAGALRCTDPDFASRAFMGLVLWFAMARTVMHDPGSRRMSGPSLVRAVVRLFLDGMRPRGVRRRR